MGITHLKSCGSSCGVMKSISLIGVVSWTQISHRNETRTSYLRKSVIKPVLISGESLQILEELRTVRILKTILFSSDKTNSLTRTKM